MGLIVATLAVRPPAANSSNHDAVIIAVNVGLAIVLVALLIAGKIVKDRIKYRRIHEGESVSKRKRVLRTGVAANAKVLSSLRLKEETDLDETHYYSIVFEVVTHGDASFRAKGVEEMPAYVRLGDGCELQAGDTVAVKYDPVDHAVFLVDRTRSIARFRGGWTRRSDSERPNPKRKSGPRRRKRRGCSGGNGRKGFDASRTRASPRGPLACCRAHAARLRRRWDGAARHAAPLARRHRMRW